MQNIEQIIVPIDFHQHTDDLVNFAIDTARTFKAKITFLHIAEQTVSGANYFETFPESFGALNEELFSQAQVKMTALVDKNSTNSPGCSGVVLRGDVVDCIVDYVKDKKGDMLIMCTHGFRGIKKILLGSVVDRVLKRASCPMLIFNPYKGETT